jgi:hypothetical protein
VGKVSSRRKALAEVVIQSVDWDAYELHAGSAHGFGELLTEFVAPDSETARDELWQTMENHVFAQDDVFSAAEPTIGVLLAALAEPRPDAVRISVLDLLFHLVQAASFRSDDLGRRCLASAAEGGWLLAREALAGGPAVVDACLEVLDICAPACARAVQLMS